MPTYRATNGVSGGRWRDAPDLSDVALPGEAADAVTEVARLAEEAGVALVVKPHPLDAGRYGRSGLRVITTEEIFRSGMTLYQFIGASAAMISDYSSVWVEYLAVDRPLVLYCPDLRDYVRGRGFSDPPMTDVVPGLIVERAQDLRSFLQAVASREDWRPDARRAGCEALGLAATPDGERFTSAVLLELECHRALAREARPAQRTGLKLWSNSQARRGRQVGGQPDAQIGG
jgi:CDP-glycerol glycerophosphotransferase (TagB/SpsB family)